MAQRKSTVDEAYPGDIVGLPDTGGVFKIGDTLTEGEQLHFRGLPSFSPELFKYIENDDPMKSQTISERFGTTYERRCSTAIHQSVQQS